MAVNYDSKEYLETVDAYWRAANYLSVGTLFLMHNPLLRRELKPSDVAQRPLSGESGPGPADGTGMAKLFKHFSFPGGTASHAAPETPGSLHEGGELGYSLSHGVGAILDNPDQIAAVEIGDGEAETGPLAASWFSDKFINPIQDGAVLPILQINGFKISNPTILARMSDEELTKYFEGMGWKPYFVSAYNGEGFDGYKDTMEVYEEMAKTKDAAIEDILAIQKYARETGDDSMPQWPMVILRAPKGWTGPKKDLDGNPIENSFRAHQIPIPVAQNDMEHKDMLINWLKSYKPEELFDENGAPVAKVTANTQRSPEQRVTDADQRAHKSGLYAVDGGFVKILFVSVCLFHRCRNAHTSQ